MPPNILLGLIGPGLVLALLAILSKRKLYARFPVFFVYCVWILAVAVVRFLFAKYPRPYFLVYWMTEASYWVLAFLSILAILRPFAQVAYRRHRWSRFLLLPTTALLIGAPIWLGFFTHIRRTPLGRFALGLYLFVLLMCAFQLVLFITAMVIRRRYPIDWSQHEFGILVGFGMLALLSLIAYLPGLLTLFYFKVEWLGNLFQYFPPGAFIGSAVVWLIAFWKPEPPRIDRPPDLGKLREAVRVLREQIEFVKQVSRDYGLDFTLLSVRPFS